jgi:hypothetical protein
MVRPRLGELLLARGVCTRDALIEAWEQKVVYGDRLGTNLLALQHLDEATLVEVLAFQHGTFGAHGDIPVDRAASRRIPRAMAETHQVCVSHIDGHTLYLLMVDPGNARAIQDVRMHTGFAEIVPVVVAEARMWQLLHTYYGVPTGLRPVPLDRRARVAPRDTHAAPVAAPVPELTSEEDFHKLYGGMHAPAPKNDAASPVLEHAAPVDLLAPLEVAADDDDEEGLEELMPVPDAPAPIAVARTRTVPTSFEAPTSVSSWAPEPFEPLAPPVGLLPSVIVAALDEPTDDDVPSPLLHARAPVTREADDDGQHPRTLLDFANTAERAHSTPSSPSQADGALLLDELAPLALVDVPALPTTVMSTATATAPNSVSGVASAPEPSAAWADLVDDALAGPATILDVPASVEEPAFARSSSREHEAVTSSPEPVLPPAFAHVHDRDGIAAVILQAARTQFARAFLLTVHADAFTGWMGAGVGVDDDKLHAFRLPRDHKSVFALVADSRAFYSGPLQRFIAHGAWVKASGRQIPSSLAVLPLVVRERVINLLVVDNGHEHDVGGEFAAIAAVLEDAARAYEVILRER